MDDVEAISTRLKQNEADRSALFDEYERLTAKLCRLGTNQARAAMRAAGFVFGESVIEERRVIHGREYTYPMGILLGVEASSRWNDEWSFYVHFRSVLASGKPGRRLDYRSFRARNIAWLPDNFRTVGTVNRATALDHPRIVRMSEYRRAAVA